MTLTLETRPKRATTAALRFSEATPNNSLAAALLLVTAIAPIPLGANGPSAWAINALLIAIIGMMYAMFLLILRNPLRVSLWRLWPETCLAMTILAFLLFQVTPTHYWGGNVSISDIEGHVFWLDQISIAPGQTVFSALVFSTYALFFFLVVQVSTNRQRALKLAEFGFAIVVAHAIWGLLALTLANDSLLIFEKWAYKGVATGTFINRNSYGTFLAIGFVIGVALSLRAGLSRKSERGQRLPRADEKFVLVGLRSIGTLLILAALLASQSRMGLGAAVSGALVVILVTLTKGGTGRSRLTALIAIGAIIAAGISFLIYGAGTLERLGSIESDADVRQQLYAQVLQLIANNWSWGTGAGTFEIAYPLYHRWPVSPDLIWDKAHNTYLTMWSELGIIFGSVPLLMFALLSARLCHQIIKRRDDWWLPTISLAAIVVVAVHSTVDFSMEIQGVVILLIFIVGIGLDLSSARTQRLPKEGTGA